MDLIATMLIAFPLGYLIRERIVAYLAFIAAYSFLFTFQSLQLAREWVGGSTQAFAKDAGTVPWDYGLVNLALYGIGLGLVTLGAVVSDRRKRRVPGAVDLAR